MRKLILSGLIIVALGAASVLEAQNANSPKKNTAKAKPISGGSSSTAGGAASGGVASGETKKALWKKPHRRKHRRHSKKA